MNRDVMLQQIGSRSEPWDIVIIGGGATGLGAAVDAASRGYKTLLIEQSDFAKGTSSRSTKLVHGGVRYLQHGDVSLVLEALHERGLLLHNAPHLVRNQSFIIPNYEWWEGPFYTVGMKVYDMMAGNLGLGPSQHLSKQQVLHEIPNLRTRGLLGGVIYHDGQFDDARLAVNLAQTCVEYGGTVINYFKCTGLIKSPGQTVNGVIACDMETGTQYRIPAKVVINATGVWADDILRMDVMDAPGAIVPSQGVHLVLDKEFLQGTDAIMIPHTDDGRVLFAVPWHNKVIVGTTDTKVKKADLEPKPLKEEISFLLNTAKKYLTRPPAPADVRSMFAGLRPLAAPDHKSKNTKEISRSHKIIVSVTGLITITGGKWTTYRKMAEDAIDKAIMIGGLTPSACITKQLKIHGAMLPPAANHPLNVYGTDKPAIEEMIFKDSSLQKQLHHALPYTGAEVAWAVKHEMARTVEDVLARRTRALFLDAKAAADMAHAVAAIMAPMLNKNNDWQKNQIKFFLALSQRYLLV